MYSQNQAYGQPGGIYAQQPILQQQRTGYIGNAQPAQQYQGDYGKVQQPQVQQQQQQPGQPASMFYTNANSSFSGQNNMMRSQPTGLQPSYQQNQQVYGQQFPIQSQQTGYSAMPQPNYQAQLQHTGYQLQAQQTGPSQPYLSQGFTGFGAMDVQQQQPFVPQVTSQPAAPKLKIQKTGANIPSTRLSFVSANDQAKFEDVFAKAVGPYNTALPGDEARAILTRSGLPSNTLSRIWTHCDTTRSGQLLFPEFVLAMHLCNTAIRQGSLPNTVDSKTINEVSSVVDQIQFAAADTTPHPAAEAMRQPNFAQNNAALLAQTFTGAPQSSYNQPQQYQAIYQQPQQTGFQQQYQYGQGMQPGLTGLQQPGLTGMPGFQQVSSQPQALPQQQYNFPITALQAQPTGRPGEWGFVRAPQGAVQGMQALGSQMMPGAAPSQGVQMPMQQVQNIPWAITKEEKAIYDTIHKAWDKNNQGFVDGPVAIQVFGTSGLPRNDLELIWALADADDKGKLNSDEFAVALHLIYRKLNGLEIPPVLPPELIPPSTRNFGDSIAQVKSMLQQDAATRNGPMSYQKNRSFKDNAPEYSKDGTVYKHDDRDVGYISSARRRAPAETTRPTATPGRDAEEQSIADLQKQVREKQVLIDAMDNDVDRTVDREAQREADELYQQIRKVSQQLSSHHNSHMLNGAEEREKANLQRQFQSLIDQLPEVASQVRAIEQKIQETQLAIFNAQEAQNNPSVANIIGTGPGGEITESDRRRAKTKAVMEARMAALTGKPVTKHDDSALEAMAKRQADKTAELRQAKEANEHMIHDIEESAASLRHDIESALAASESIRVSEHERRRWDEGVGVETEVRDFIRELKKDTPHTARPVQAALTKTSPPAASMDANRTAPQREATPTYNSFNGAEDRATYLKQQAEARMAERLAALGIKPTKRRDIQEQKSNTSSSMNHDTERAALKAEDDERKQAEEDQLAKQKAEEEDRRRTEAERSAAPTKSEVSSASTASLKSDSKAARLAKLQADRAARLAEEERLERELAEATSSYEEVQEAIVNGTQSVNQSVPRPEVETAKIVTAPQVDNNPFNKLKTTASDVPAAQSNNPFAKAVAQRPPPVTTTQPQRTNAPRPKAVRQNSDNWSNASRDESSSDEEGPTPADLAARLFSGGMQPQRTGAQTPLSAQRTGAAASPTIPQAKNVITPSQPVEAPPAAPPIPAGSNHQHPPPPPGPPPVPSGIPAAPPGPPPLPAGFAPPPPGPPPPSAPPAFSPPSNLPPGPPPLPSTFAPPPPPAFAPPPPGAPPPALFNTGPAAPNTSASAPPPGARNALLSSIQAGKGLRKVKTVEKGGVSGGRVLE